jgi:hypothetical protein
MEVRMTARRFLTFASLGLCLIAVPADARDFKLPQVGYSAERTVKRGDRWQAMQVHYTPGMERMDLEGDAAGGNVMIVRYDKGVTWIVLPRLRAYVELSGDVSNSISAVAQSLALNPVGHERIGDVDTTKYRLDGKITGFMWLGQRDIPVRIDGDMAVGETSAPTHFEQNHIKIGPQDPALFELPEGLVRIEIKDARMLGLMQQLLGG